MSPVTGDPAKNYQDLIPFREDQLSLLRSLFSSGDSDPRWSVGPGAENAIKLNRSREFIAQAWGLPAESLIFVPERYLAFHLAIMGSFGSGEFSRLAFSPIEKKEILAIASALPTSSKVEGRISLSGQVLFESLDSEALIIHQLRNGETGIHRAETPYAPTIIDATSATPNHLALNDQWRAVVIDATSWDGPRGVYALAINPDFAWKNPFPTLDTAFPIYGSNYGLTMLAAATLEQFIAADQSTISEGNHLIRAIASEAGDVDVAGEETGDRLSLSFLYVQSEELQRRLYLEGYLVDSGSACSSSVLEPSHVLTRMGLLSQGNVRLRIRPTNLAHVEEFAHALVKIVHSLRSQV